MPGGGLAGTLERSTVVMYYLAQLGIAAPGSSTLDNYSHGAMVSVPSTELIPP